MARSFGIAKPNGAVYLAFLAWALLPGRLVAESQSLFYYVPDEDAWQSLSANVKKITILGPQVFTVNAQGEVAGTVEERVRLLAAQYEIRVMPLLVNENFDPQVAHSILSDESLRKRVISDSVRLCQQSGCWGFQLDFENVLPEDGKDYTLFVREAAKAFHERRLRFSVAVPPPLVENGLPPGSPGSALGGFRVFPGPYDLKQLSRYADFISLMTYDHYTRETAPGPIAGYTWVEQNIQFVLRLVSRKKLFLGLGFYARHWCDHQVSESSFPEVVSLAGREGVSFRWHPVHRSPWFEFDGTDCRNLVWFENQESLREKLRLVQRYRLAGFSAWRLGQEDPAFWKELSERKVKGPKSKLAR